MLNRKIIFQEFFMDVNKKKKIIIIGAGISGLTAGIYGLDNDFDVEIYEKHTVPGGECTGWTRQGVFIDGCAHWIVGTNKNSDLYPTWEHVGALTDDTKIYETEYFTVYDIGDGETFTLYADLDKLYAEMMRIAPEDKKYIKRIIRGIEAYQHVRIPMNKPIDMMNFFELIDFGFRFLPMLPAYIKYKHMSMERFADGFTNPKLRDVFKRILCFKEYNAHSFFYIMQGLSKEDAGMMEGGSKNVADNVTKKYLECGGKLFLNSPVKSIIIEENKAIGVELVSGEKKYADYIVGACDAHHLVYDLLGDKYEAKFFREQFLDRKNYPLNAAMLFAYKTNINLNHTPKMVDFKNEQFKVGEMEVTHLSVRNHSFDETLNHECSTVTVLLPTIDSVYDYFKALSKEDYKKEKLRLGEIVKKEIAKYYNIKEEDLTLIDVTTPLTYERYCNAYRGSYMSFVTTEKQKTLMGNQKIKGLKNFVVSGQWNMGPGGLPIAIFTGKHAIIRICKFDKRKFINKETKKAHFYLKKATYSTKNF